MADFSQFASAYSSIGITKIPKEITCKLSGKKGYVYVKRFSFINLMVPRVDLEDFQTSRLSWPWEAANPEQRFPW